MLTTIIATIIVLGVLIFVHELGHFVTAKMVDIEVPRFSIGLGPKLWGFRRGETEYVISWLPLGGYVKMAGMEEMEAIEGGPAERQGREGDAVAIAASADAGAGAEAPKPGPRDFESKSLPARALVIAAGALMNFIFAFLVFAASAFVWGVDIEPAPTLPTLAVTGPVAGAEALAAVPAGTRITSLNGREVRDWGELRLALATASAGPATLAFEGAQPATIEIPAEDSTRAQLIQSLDPALDPVVRQIVSGQPAERAGLRANDRIVAVAGTPVESWPEVVSAIQARPGQATTLDLLRAGQSLSITVTPEPTTLTGPEGEERTIGRIGAGTMPVEKPGVAGALAYGGQRTVQVTGLIVSFLGDLFSGDASPRNLGGPIMIGQISGEVARAGLEAFLSFMALFSVNLAVLNLLPIPVLDGGHLMFLAVEGVRGRALTFQQRMRFTQLGFMVVVAIMVWAFANDVLRLFGL